MSQFYPIPVVGIVGMTVGLILSRATTLPDEIAGAVAVVAGLTAGVAWILSPLPNGTTVAVSGGAADE